MMAATQGQSGPGGAWPTYATQQATKSVGCGMVPAIMLACLVGTGGHAGTLYWSSRQVGYQPPVIRTHHRSVVNTAHATTPADQLNLIRETLKPAMTDLAAVFGLSRQALYSWASGEKQPSADNAAKLEDIAHAAGLLAAAGLVGSQVGRRKVAEGKTLLQIAQSGGSASQAAEKLIAILKREADQRARMAARFAGRSPASASAESIGVPMLHERT